MAPRGSPRGYQNNPGGAVDPDDDQVLGFIPPQPQPATPPNQGTFGKILSRLSAVLRFLNPSVKFPGTTNFLKNHWPKTLVGTFLSVSLLQSQIENPEHSTFSWEGGKNGVSRIGQNIGWWVGGAWNLATGTAKPVLKTANLVNSGTQAAPYFIVCMDKELKTKLADKDPRARAFTKVVQGQLNNEAAHLAFQNAAFYKKNAHYNVGNGAPVAVFHIEDVPPSWSPSIPYILEAPVPYEQKAAELPGAGCGVNEIRMNSPIPGVGGLKP